MSVIFHLFSTKTIMPNLMLFLRASSSLSCPLCLHPYSDNMCLNGKGKLVHPTAQWSREAEPRERNSFHLSRALERPNFPVRLSSRAPVTKRYPPPLPPSPRTRIKSVICVVSVLPHLEFLVYLQLKRGGENQIFQSFHISISSQGKRAMYGNRIVVFAIVLLLVV